MPARSSTKKTTARKSGAARKTASAPRKTSTAARTGKQGKLSTIMAALTVLDKAGKALTVAEIAEAATPLTGLSGATPKQTFYSVLYAELKKTAPRISKSAKGGTFKITAAGKKALTEKAA